MGWVLAQDNALDIRVRDFAQLPSYAGMPTPFKAITLKSLEYEPKMPNFPLKYHHNGLTKLLEILISDILY